MNSNEYLYYKVTGSDFTTTNKLQAIEKAGGKLDNIKLYFCDHEHKKHDWTKEPKESIHSLTDRRVRELRNKYDYVCLWYSGGFDSHTLLNSFIRTGSKIDEIIIYGKPWIKDVMHSEHLFASEFIKKIKHNIYPDLKINYVLLSDKIHSGLYKKFGSDWIYYDCQNSFSYIKSSRGLGLQYQPEFVNLKFQPNRIDICGTDKPRVDLRDGKWYSTMPDNAILAWFDAECDLFYMCPDATEIYIKQCWNVIKWFESMPHCSHELVHEVQSLQRPLYYSAWNLAIGRDDVFHPVAKHGLTKKFYSQGAKSLDSLHYEFSNNIHAESDVYKSYKTGLSYLYANYKDIWSENRGFDVVMSDPIYIKDFEPSFDAKT
jgi:hypothetical protein